MHAMTLWVVWSAGSSALAVECELGVDFVYVEEDCVPLLLVQQDIGLVSPGCSHPTVPSDQDAIDQLWSIAAADQAEVDGWVANGDVLWLYVLRNNHIYNNVDDAFGRGDIDDFLHIERTTDPLDDIDRQEHTEVVGQAPDVAEALEWCERVDGLSAQHFSVAHTGTVSCDLGPGASTGDTINVDSQVRGDEWGPFICRVD